MTPFVGGLLLVASIVTAATVILGGVWWLLRPRVESYLGRLVANSERATQGCVTRLEAVANRLDAHADAIKALERTRHPIDLDELVDLIELVGRYRPQASNWPPPPNETGNPT